MDEGERQRVYRYLELYPTVEMGAVHPLDIVAPSQISQSYANDWLYASIDRLWGYNPSTKKVEQKTIYDPCPYGYRVADDELFALFYHAYYNNNYTSKDYGIIINQIIFHFPDGVDMTEVERIRRMRGMKWVILAIIRMRGYVKTRILIGIIEEEVS